MDLLRRLEKSQWLNAREIADLQLKKLKRLLGHAYANCSYYREAFGDLNLTPDDIHTLEDCRLLPVLDKAKIKERAADIKAKNFAARDMLPNSTSGSTGVTLNFFSDRKASKIHGALGLRGDRWAGWKIGEKKIMLWGSVHDQKTNLYRKAINTLLHRRLILSSYGMNKRSMIDYRYKVNRFKPRLIEGYASALYLFSKFLKDNQLKIHRPLGIISAAETLYPHQRELIESAFHCRVFNRYGSREVNGIAQECEKHNGLHVFAEHVIVEILDEDNRPCRPGEIGKIVVTDLDNHAFPFLRYDIGDLGVESDRVCSCGRGLPMLARVEGRVWDVIVGANGNRLVGTFWLVSGIKGIKQFQVQQENLGEMVILVVGEAAFTQEEKQKLLNKVYANCGPEMKVELRLVDQIPQTESGKHHYIISKVSPFV